MAGKDFGVLPYICFGIILVELKGKKSTICYLLINDHLWVIEDFCDILFAYIVGKKQGVKKSNKNS